MNIVITGFMGTGKTVVGKELARRLNFKYIDTDDIIEERTKMKISEIFEKYGEKYFRDIETKVAKEVGKYDKHVISTGGGIVLRKENMQSLEENGIIVNLRASPETIYQRTLPTKGSRPLLNKPEPMKEIIKLLKYREPFYKRCHLMIKTDNLDVNSIVNKILNFINEKNLLKT